MGACMTLSLSAFSGFNIDLYLLVFMRMSGLFIFNPIFGRANIPVTLRAALGFICALVVVPTLSGMSVQIGGIVQLIVMSLGELFIGLAIGVVVNLMINAVQFAGELIDMQMGLTMAQQYDANSGVNMPLLGSFFNSIMILCFFASNAHISLITFVSDSFRLIAPGNVFPTQQSMHFIFSLGKDYFELGLRMAIPVVAIEIVCQISMGMLMKAVPSINIFSIGTHIEALVGILIILFTITPLVNLCGQIVTYMLEKVVEVIKLMGTGT